MFDHKKIQEINFEMNKNDSNKKYLNNNWLKYDGDELLFKNNIFVKFSIVNLNNIDRGINKFNFIATSLFVDKNYEIDINNQNSRNKLREIYDGNILFVKINCDNLDEEVINIINKQNNNINILEKINVEKNSKFGTLILNISELFMFSENIPNIITLIKFSYQHNFEIIFYFENVIWYKLIFGFAKNNIFISGGNSTKRHLLSFNHLILSLFLVCFDKNYIFNIKNNLNNDIDFISNISKQKFIDCIYIKGVDIKNLNASVLDLIINFIYHQQMYFYLDKKIKEFINRYPYFISYKSREDIIFNNESGVIIRLDVSSDNESDKDKDKARYLLLKNIDRLKFVAGSYNLIKNEIPNYDYLKSLIELFRNSNSKLIKLNKLIQDILPVYVIDNNKLNKENKNNINKNLYKLIKQVKTVGKLNSKLLKYNSQDISKYSTMAYQDFRRSFHSSNWNSNSNSNFEINSNIYNSLNDFSFFNKKIVNNELNLFVSDLYNNPLYNRLIQILKDDNIKNNYLKQTQIEKVLNFFWKKEIENLFQQKKHLFSSGYGIELIITAIIKLKRDISDLKKSKIALKGKIYKDYIILLDDESIISIVLSNVLPNCINNYNLNLAGLYEKVGKEIINDFFNQEWIKYKNSNINKDNSISNILTKDDFVIKLKTEYPNLSYEDYFKIGSDLIEYLGDKTNLFKLINKKNDDKTVNRILIADTELEDVIIKIITFDNEKLPMICEPNKWDIKNEERDLDINKHNLDTNLIISNYGGYILNKNNKISFIRQSQSNIGKILFKNDYIIKTLNKLASVSYSINYNVLEYIFDLFNNNNKHIFNIIKLKPHPQTKELFNLSLKHKWAKIHEIQKYNNQYYNDKSVLQLVFLFFEWLKFKDNSLYFPFFIDWRGRFYTDTSYFSFQTGEFVRSLIVFKKGSVLNKSGLEALKIYTANCYGYNKLSYNQRLEWVNSNLNNILNMEPDFIFNANEPLLFLACCFELKGYFKDKDKFISTLPIYLDATCNGLQHLASMVNDTNLAKYVNIIKSDKNDIPNDLYTSMVEIININIQNLIESNPEYSKLKFVNIIRDLVKRGLMTIPYGVTVRGISSQLQEDYFTLLDPEKGKKRVFLLNNFKFNKTNTDLHLNYKEIYKLAEIIHDVLYNSFPNLKFVVIYFKEMNKLLKNLGLSTVWLTPSGMLIEQKYVKTIKKEIISSILGKRKSITINKPDKDKISLIKQNSGIVPNIVHSLDASNVALLIKGLLDNNQDIDILTIHDCFGCQANNVDLMVLQVKIAFLSIYGKDKFTEMYHKFIIEYIIKTGYTINKNKVIDFKNKIYNIPSIPIIGDNIKFKENILGSQYFFN